MAIDFSTAVNAYKEAANAVRANKTTAAAGGAAEDVDGSFAALVSDSLKGAVASGREAETLSMKQIAGEADLKDVVVAVANAEQTLQTVVAVRDKVLSAYQEILKMPI
jgi:flagellar hook-basal body complex protein FliE